MNSIPHWPEGAPLAGSREPIAIIGIGCRFPGGADSPDKFWRLLNSGVDAITEVPAERWNARTFFDDESGKPGKSSTRWGGFLASIDQFDPHFFGISPREAAWMDPQQRLLLETAWEALEDAGQVQDKLARSRTAVYVGISSWDYSVAQTSFRDRGVIDVHTNTGSSLSIAANRIAYCLDFRGPSASVDTACSSALVAVHLACQSIWVEKCPLALAGGVNLLLMPDWYVGFSRLGMLSPHGRCKAFDAAGAGFVRSEGAGMVVLKPLSRALADGDRVYAVIRGTAVNQDGRTNGMTVPSQEAQEALVRQACDSAGIQPAGLDFVEAHGTGTPVGDPIEARALGNVIAPGRPADRPCLLGSVKTNIGHLEAGAGIAGLIKTALALHHRVLPGNLHFERPNPDIDFAGLKLRVPTTNQSLSATGDLLAGVNSFGFGGTNAHTILQSPPAPAVVKSAVTPSLSQPVVLSARNADALRAAASELRDFVAGSPQEISLYDIASHAALRRTHQDHRLTVIAGSKDDLSQRLDEFLAGSASPNLVSDRLTVAKKPKLAFICCGQGPQWWAMGRQLLDQEAVFRAVIERCDCIVRGLGDWSLLEELTRAEGESRLNQTAISQPAIFALQVALAELWRSWGVTPDAVIGHSVGEIAAAHLAGIFTLEDATRIIFHRGRCMDRASAHGHMLAAALTREEAERLLAPHGDAAALAAVNSPSSVTISGDPAPLAEIARQLQERGIFHRQLQVQYAFHSAHMDPVQADLLAALAGIRPQPATLPFVSTVQGKQLAGPELSPEYWWHNVRQGVRFADGVDRLVELGCDTALELGPHPVLAAAIAECYQQRGRKVKVVASLRRKEDERDTMLRALGLLHGIGYSINWSGVFSERGQFVSLPTYPWQRERCWHESSESRWSRLTAPVHPLLGMLLPEPRPTWEARLDIRLLPYLADHRVQRSIIVPATAFLEMAFAVARESLPEAGIQLEDVKLTNPCFIAADKPVRIQTTYQPESGFVQTHGRGAEDDTDWTLHCRAHLRAGTAVESPTHFDAQAIIARCPKRVSGADCFAYSHRIGLDYGPAFQGIEHVYRGNCEAIGDVRLPEPVAGDVGDYLFHPALLDSCFQVAICADPSSGELGTALYLPTEIERIRFHRRPGGKLWCHARQIEKTPRWTTVEIDVYDETGHRIIEVRGLRSHCVAGHSAEEALNDLLHAYQWELSPRREPPATNGTTNGSTNGDLAHEPAHWLIFADRTGKGDELATRFRRQGQRCTTVMAGTRFFREGENCFHVDPGSANDMDRLLRELPEPVSGGIVHLWNLDAPAAKDLSVDDLEDAQVPGLLSVLHLVHSWDRASEGLSAPLFLVTRGVQAVAAQDAVAVAQSPVVGLGRVITNEYPRLRCKLIDLDPETDDLELLDEIALNDNEDEVAWRGGDRYVHRFVAAREPGKVDTTAAAYRLTTPRPGTLDSMRLQAIRCLPPAEGEVQIEVVAAGLNFSDVMKALGLYPGMQPGPVPLGAECSGRVTAVGAGVQDFQLGDEVMAVAPFAFASHVTTRADLVARKPARLTFEEAAAVPIVFLTAAYALEHLARIEAGERVLIHSASGGLGLAAVQLARKAGAEILATAGTQEKRAFLNDMGIVHAFDSRSLAFADEVLAVTGGRGVNIVLNSLAGEALVRSVEVLDDYGRFLEVGKRDIYQNARLGLKPFRNNLSFFAIDLDRVMRDRPAFLGKMLRDLARQFDDGTLSPLPQQVFPVGDAVNAFRCMQHARHVGKIVVSMRETPAAVVPAEDEPLTLRDDASYLVTGGLGGFGLAVAQWLVERGARHLVLVGRRGVADEATQKVLDDLAAKGAHIVVKRTDISRETDVATLLAEIDRELPPLRGIFHSAMVLEDSLLLKLDDDLMKRVLAPKMQGSWNLHRQTQNRPLDFFVLFSSLSSVFGHAGQGNYAAANLFLDALAHHRRALGLPALSVNWGYLGEVGYLAQRPQLGERLERQGVLSFSVGQALSLLERALHRQLTQVSVMRVDWSRWRGLGVTGRLSPRFGHLLKNRAGSTGSDGPLAPREAVQAAAAEERHGVIGTLLRDKVARILGDSSARLDAEKSLVQLGVDSLMAVELRNWIEEELRVTLPIVELMRSPTLNRLAELVASQWAKTEAGEGPADIAADVGSDIVFPLSHGQRGLWVMQQMDRDSAVQNISLPLRFRSTIDLDVFRGVLQTVLDRHPALRSTFAAERGELVQRVHDDAKVHFEVVDATAWSEEQLQERLSAEAHRPFDLEHGPPFRAFLFTRGPEDHVFLGTLHHIVGDFWSLVVGLEEMRLLYAAALAGKEAVLPAKASYRDFVAWQANMLAGPEGDRLRAYWQAQLAGVPTVLELPTDRSRPARSAHRGEQVLCRLDADLTRRLKALAAREEVTLFTVLLGAFQILLGRYSGQKDCLVGSPVTGRSRPEFANVIGYFMNLIPLRARLASNPTTRDFIRQSWQTILDALSHQDYPFPLLIEKLTVPRQTGQSPLVQVLFALERSHLSMQRGVWQQLLSQQDGSRVVDGLRLETCNVEQHTVQYDLEMVLEEGEDTVEGIVRYDAELFDQETVSRLVEHFLNLLQAMLAHPDRPVLELPMITPAERRLVVYDWNQTYRDYPQDLCLHHLFEQRARATPDAVALTFRGRTMTYADLDGWANNLAHRLVALGVKPEVCVALLFERSPEMIVAILAVLKAGGAYVPLDPASPRDKLKAILDEVLSPVVLTQRHLENRLPETGSDVIGVEHQPHAADGRYSFGPELAAEVGPDNLAYVIFTSGTTGRPKGVMVDHRSICNTILWQQEKLPVVPEDRYLLSLAYFFDASICSIFIPLATGALLVLPEPGTERDPSRLLECMIEERATVVESVPSMLRLFIDHPRFPECRWLRWLSSGGEALPVDLPDRLFAILPVDLYNLYGPTETTVEATWWKCLLGDTRSSVPIGWPIANMQAYILDEFRNPAPLGVPGELWMGGVGVARGYLNDPDKTAERFVPNHFTGQGRMYRTGDRCRWRADGSIEYYGRIDQQVKVSGYRIEVEEIETLLVSIPEVREAAVAVHGDGVGSQRLVAYLVPRDGAELPTIEVLRKHLKEKLPAYALPSAYVTLEELPITPTGKIDRKALPLPVLERPNMEQAYVAPRTAVEEFLAELWAELLHVEQVGIEDNFFELGGSSILGVHMINHLQEKLGEHIYVIALFEAPTISGLMRHLADTCPDRISEVFGADALPAASRGYESNGQQSNGQHVNGTSASPSPELLVPLQPRGTKPPLFVVHPPGGIVACYQPLSRHLGGGHPLYGIRAAGFHGEPVPATVEEMAADYLAAMRDVQPQGPYHIGGWSMGGIIALEMAQQLRARGEEVGLLTLFDTTIPHNDANRPYVGEDDLTWQEYGLDFTLEELAQLGPDEQLPYLWEHARKLGVVDDSTPLPLVQRMLDDLKRLFHAHIELGNAYAVRHYPGKITLFRPLEAPVHVPMPDDRGWGQLADAVDVYFVPGQHHSMVQEPHVHVLAERLRECLANAAANAAAEARSVPL